MEHIQHNTALLQTNKVLSQTYQLLSMTLAFSALTAFIGMQTAFYLPPLVTLIGYFALLFAVSKTRNSAAGLFWVFALTGFLGLTIAPMLNYVLATKGADPIIMALLGTGGIFFIASGYGRTTSRDLTRMGPFLMIGALVAFVASLMNVFFLQLGALQMAISALFMVVSSGIMAWYTNLIVRGGETNYMMATVVLFVAIYNVFISLLSLLGSRD